MLIDNEEIHTRTLEKWFLLVDCTAKEMMAAIEARNRVSSNAEVGTLLQKLFNMKYDGTAGVRDYVLRMVDLKAKLQALNVTIPDACIVIKP